MDANPIRRSGRGLLIVLLVAVSLVLGLSQVLAQAADPQPTREPEAQPEVSPYARILSPTAELLALEWSVERYVAAHSIPADLLLPANLDPSNMTVSAETVAPGGTVRYTITVVNSGDSDVVVTVTDNLPNQLDYVDHTCAALLTESCSYTSGVVSWKGTAITGQEAVITIDAKVGNNVALGTKITNTAQIKGGGDTINVSAQVTVKRQASSPIQVLPLIIYGLRPEPQAVVLTAGVPNAANQWTLTWTPAAFATSYELQASLSPTFENAPVFILGPQTSFTFNQTPSWANVFYYRVRSFINDRPSAWSNIASVTGGYFDDFNDSNSGWAIRRNTYWDKAVPNEVRGFYEITDSRSWYVMYIDTSFDWGIASPGWPAPRVPYYIEYESRNGDIRTPNVTHGFSFSGDWPSTSGCPSDPNSEGGVRRHKDCFNHFYNTNGIFYGKANGTNEIKLLFERVDKLVWCLECWGSPMKRTGDINENGVRDYEGIDPTGWNKYRIEVRQSGIKIFAAKRGSPLVFQKEYTDTRWIGDPYFGVFASTDEWNDSIWQFDYVRVMPLDN